jgi:hypothetical protein
MYYLTSVQATDCLDRHSRLTNVPDDAAISVI